MPDNKLTDNLSNNSSKLSNILSDSEIKKALDICSKSTNGCSHSKYTCEDCYLNGQPMCSAVLLQDAIDCFNRLQAENSNLTSDLTSLQNDLTSARATIDSFTDIGKLYSEIKAEAYKEVKDKITELFLRYAFLHSHADMARKDYIEAVDGTKIEMQSVWDVFTLRKNGIADYDEMNRLQTNIELIEKGRLLTELEKDFRLLVKELVGEDK